MSRATAEAKALRLREALLDHGVPEVRINLLEGRPNPYADRWDALHVVADFSHHTVSRYSPTRLTPSRKICRTGRSDVPGPLCNGYGGWDLAYEITTLGYANHSGAGGPYLVNGYKIPKDSARRYTFGTEYEGGLSEADWDRKLVNPRTKKAMTFREFMGRSNAGIQDYFNLPRKAHIEHRNWTMGNPVVRDARKIDRLGYTLNDGIAEIGKYTTVATTLPEVHNPPVNSAGQRVMHFGALRYAGQHRYVSGWYLAYVDQALSSLALLGIVPANHPRTEFPEAWQAFEKAIGRAVVNSIPDEHSFTYFVQRCGYRPPDGSTTCGGPTFINDWP